MTADPPMLTLEDGRQVYVVAISQRMFSDMQLSPRERWKLEYREERMRRKGVPESEFYPYRRRRP